MAAANMIPLKMANLPVSFNGPVPRRRRRRATTPCGIKFEEHDGSTLCIVSSRTQAGRRQLHQHAGGRWSEQYWPLVWITTAILCHQELCVIVDSFAPQVCAPNIGFSTRLKVTRTNEPPPSSSTDEEFKQRRSIVSSNFWYSVVSTEDSDEEAEIVISGTNTRENDRRAPTTTSRTSTRKIPKLPCVPTLDADGPLPRNAYVNDHLCRVQVAWDVTSFHGGENVQVTKEDVTEMVQTLQRFTDAGLTSFQIKSDGDHSKSSSTTTSANNNRQQLRAWAERNIYGALIRDTPLSVLQQHCRLTVPLCLRDTVASNVEHGSKVTYKSTRAAVVESLGRMGSSSVDDLQIQFRSNPTLEEINYSLDLLDALQELQRDGLVRAVSGRNMSDQFWHHAQRVGLGSLLETNQIDSNLLNPDSILRARISRESFPEQTTTPSPLTVVANALAGGWMTDRWWYVDTKKQSAARLYQNLSPNEQACWKRFVSHGSWARKHNDAGSNSNWGTGGGVDDFPHVLNVYQQQLLGPLQDMAHKHSTSIAAIVLRWTLQMPHVAGTVVACRLWPEHCYWDAPHRSSTTTSLVRRIQDLRQVFRFALDDEDLERLRELSGHVESSTSDSFYREQQQQQRPAWLVEQQQQNEQQLKSGLFLPRGDLFDN